VCCTPIFFTKSIPGFDNPVTKRPGGTEYSASQQELPVKATIYAIAIAPDSYVDCCDVYINGDVDNAQHRIRISAERPFIGAIVPEQGVNALVFVPVRASVPVTGTDILPDTMDASQFPRLKLQIYQGAPPPHMAFHRAPQVERVHRTGVTGAVQSIYIPTAGRPLWDIGVMVENGAGGWAATTVNVFGAMFTVTAAGVLTGILELLTVPSIVLNAGNPSDVYEYNGGPWDAVGITVDGDAGTYDYHVMFNAYDKQ